MGQASIPILNRNGYSMFWLSSWDNTHTYSTNFNEDVFIRSIFYFMVNDKYSSNFIFSKQKLYQFAVKSNNLFLKDFSKKNISEFLQRLNKIPYYISKIRVLKFQQWCLVYFYLYNYKAKVKLVSKNFFFNYFSFSKKNNFFTLKKKSNYLFDF